eukprot:TRINITY_DN5161_c1_g1_i7.p1 TRINITY_DN5161_c1_g1~~TRINITY_DN5161_c1_g1_i7.p1  ORF type:complete len:321 (-),score=20.77 TRINITY_DN5161_c1_g1_i7:625-1587(-)
MKVLRISWYSRRRVATGSQNRKDRSEIDRPLFHQKLLNNPSKLREVSPPLSRAQVIDFGSYAFVYKSSYSGIPVAIKVFRMEHQSPLNDEQDDAFKHELSIISQLDHKYIVKFYGACVRPGSRALVMEFVEFNLYKAMKNMRKRNEKENTNRKFALTNIFIIIKGIASALDYLHSKKIVHRDLHPQNVLLSKNGDVKVADVGISKVLQRSTQTNSKRSGASAYLAPEIFNGYDHCKSDIFSLGIIARELWTLDQTWTGLGDGRLCQKIKSGERPNIPDDMPPNLRDLIISCWHQDYHMRPSAFDVVQKCKSELAILSAYK